MSAATTLSRTEFERLVRLFPYPRGWTNEHGLGAEARASLMATNTPAVARKWLEDEGLLDCPRCHGKGLEGQDDRPGLLLDSERGTDECRRCHGTGVSRV
jgi:hypothetical protein